MIHCVLLLQEHFSEFEPDTKPINPKGPTYIHGKRHNDMINENMAAHYMTQKERNIAMTMSSAMVYFLLHILKQA